MTLFGHLRLLGLPNTERMLKMNKPAIAGQSAELLLWANNLLEQQNEILQQTCKDLREVIANLQDKITRLETDNRVLRTAVQRYVGVR